MIRQFLKDLGIYSISGGFVYLMSFLLIPVYVRVLSTADYGIIDLLALMTTLAGVVLSLELYQSIARLFPEAGTAQRHVLASTGFVYYLLIFSCFAIGMVVFSKAIGTLLLGVEGKEQVVRYAGFAAGLTALFQYCQNLLRYSLQSLRFAIANIVFAVASITCSIIYVVVLNQGLEGVFIGQIWGSSLGLLVSAFFNRSYLRFSVNLKVFGDMARFSSPLVASGLAVYALIYVDRILIRHYLGLSDLGVYAVAFRVGAIPMALIGLVGASLVPVIYNNFKDESVKADLEKIYRLTFFGAFVLMTLMTAFSAELIALLATADYARAGLVLPFLMLAGFFLQFANLFPGLAIRKKTSAIALIYIGGLLLSVAGNLLLIPMIGLPGAALASAFSALAIFMVQFFLSQKHYPVPVPIRKYALFLILSCLIAFVGFYAQRLDIQWSLMVRLCLFGFYFYCFFLMAGVRNSIFGLFKTKDKSSARS
jgi:O-antigen/teichoic acid export membrane protein